MADEKCPRCGDVNGEASCCIIAGLCRQLAQAEADATKWCEHCKDVQKDRGEKERQLAQAPKES